MLDKAKTEPCEAGRVTHTKEVQSNSKNALQKKYVSFELVF